MIGKIFADFSGLTKKWGEQKNDKFEEIHKIKYSVSKNEWDKFQQEVKSAKGDTVRIKTAIDNSALKELKKVERLYDYAVKQSAAGENTHLNSVNNLIQTQNYQNIATQAHGITGVTNAINEYNKTLIENEDHTFKASDGTKKLNETISQSNSSLGTYLTGLDGAKAGILNYGMSLATATVKTFTLRAATMALNTVTSLGISFLVSSGISAIASFVDKLIVTKKEIKEAGEAARSAIDQIKSDFNNLKKETDDIKIRYANLAQGIDNLGKVNQSRGKLSTDDYEEFLDLSNQLAELFPQLKVGCDDNGNAILNLSGNIDTIVGSLNNLVDVQQRLANQEIMDKMPDVWADYISDLENYNENYTESSLKEKNYLSALKKLSSNNKTFESEGNYAEDGGVNYTDRALMEVLESMDYPLHDFYRKQDLRFSNSYKINWDFSSLSETEIEKVKNKLGTLAKQNADKAELTKYKIESANSDISNYVYTWLSDEPNFNKMQPDMQNVVKDALFNSDWVKHLPDELDTTDWDNVVEWLQENFLFAVNKIDDDKIKTALNGVLSGSFSVESLQGVVKELTKTEGFNKNNPLIIYLQSKIDDKKEVESQYQNALAEAKRQLGGYVYDDRGFETNNNVGYSLDVFWNNNVINEEDWVLWKKVTEGITDATVAMNAYTEAKNKDSASKPFSEVWASIGKTGDKTADNASLDAKQKLLELAETGKLTAAEFSQSPLADYFKETGLSVDKIIEKINKMKSSASQLASMKTGISSIASILGEKEDNLSSKETRKIGVGADTLNTMPDDIKAQSKEYEHFVKVLGSGESEMEECKEAANELASAYISSNNFLANLTDNEKDYYVSLLKEMGIKNAAKIVDDAWTAKKQKQELKTRALEAATQDLGKKTSDATDKFLNQTKGIKKNTRAAKLARLELFELIAAEKIFGNSDLSTDAKTKELNKLAEKYLGISAAIQTSAMFADPRYYPDEESRQQAIEKQEKKIQATYNRIIKKQRKLLLGDIDIDENANGKKQDKDTGNDEDTDTVEKKATQKFDWISRALDRLSSKLDFVKAKYDNLFTNSNIKDSDLLLEKRNKNLDKQYNLLEKTAKYQDKAQKKYKKKADSVRISKNEKEDASLKKAVHKGRIKGSQKELIATYGEKKANKIQKYQDWYDKYKEQKKNLENTKSSMHENRRQEIQNNIDYMESKRSNLQAKRESVFSSGDKNSYITDELSVVEDLYEYQIKLAEYEKDSLKASQLKAEQEKIIRDLKAEQHQNNIKEIESYLDLLSIQKENALSAAQKNSIIDRELNATRQLYAEQKEIANLEGNADEASRLDEELKAKENQAVLEKAENIRDEHSNRLDAIDRNKSATDARISKKEALGLGQSRADYEEQINHSKNRQAELQNEKAALETYLSALNLDESDPVYRQIMDYINNCDTGIAECVTEQINYNKAIRDMDLKNYESLISLLERGGNVYNRYKSLAELHGSKLPEDETYKQIANNDRIINANQEAQKNILDNIKTDLMSNYSDAFGFHLTEEQAGQFIEYVKSAPEQLPDFMESLGIKDFNEEQFSGLFENMNKFYAKEDELFQKIEENERLVDELFDNRISSINDYLDALKKEKDVKDRTFAIEKAQYELNKAKNNLTKKVWDGAQWIYTADTDAVQSAQEAYDNTQYEELVNVLENLIETLEDTKKEVNLYDDYGNPINSSDKETVKKIVNDSLDRILTSAFSPAFNIPATELPDFTNSPGNNSMNIDKIEFILPNINDKSNASDLTESFVNQLLNLPTYSKQYDWNK